MPVEPWSVHVPVARLVEDATPIVETWEPKEEIA